eukprot:SAG11_NODE_18857_length_479_cov_5.400000_1_plen_51_part_10
MNGLVPRYGIFLVDLVCHGFGGQRYIQRNIYTIIQRVPTLTAGTSTESTHQ